MAHFRAEMKGHRGAASRLGTKASGILAKVNGWNSGVTVQAVVNSQGEDVFHISMNGGSNGRLNEKFIGTVKLENGKLVFNSVDSFVSSAV